MPAHSGNTAVPSTPHSTRAAGTPASSTAAGNTAGNTAGGGATRPAPPRPGTFRTIMFRVVATVSGLLLLVGFGAWRGLMTPWLPLPDEGGHGWERTPELHLPADTASALLMAAAGLAALFLAVRPAGHAALATWTAAMLGATGAIAPASAAVQGQDVLGALLFSIAWMAVLVTPFVLLHPERAAVLRGGTPGSATGGPPPLATAGLLVLGAAGLALAAVVVTWRVGGGFFENRLEDDVVGLTLLGVSLALGAFLCVRRRTGWPALAWFLAGMGVYGVAAGVSIAVG